MVLNRLIQFQIPLLIIVSYFRLGKIVANQFYPVPVDLFSD